MVAPTVGLSSDTGVPVDIGDIEGIEVEEDIHMQAVGGTPVVEDILVAVADILGDIGDTEGIVGPKVAGGLDEEAEPVSVEVFEELDALFAFVDRLLVPAFPLYASHREKGQP